MASELVYLRDLDGTGSMHVCASGDGGAIAYAPAVTRPAPVYAGMVERFYIDCEFDGHGGQLLSMALVRQDGDSIHIRTTAEPNDPWVQQNVMPVIDSHMAAKSATGIDVYGVGAVVRAFIGDVRAPVIIADSPVDIWRFCQAVSTSPSGGWASAEYPLMTFEVHNVDCYPTALPSAVRHNAWWDAMALREKLETAATALTALTERNKALEAEVERLRKLTAGQWFYTAGYDSEDCRDSPGDVLECLDMKPGRHVVGVDVATPLPSIWLAVHVRTNEEMDAAESYHRVIYTEHATEALATAALGDRP